MSDIESQDNLKCNLLEQEDESSYIDSHLSYPSEDLRDHDVEGYDEEFGSCRLRQNKDTVVTQVLEEKRIIHDEGPITYRDSTCEPQEHTPPSLEADESMGWNEVGQLHAMGADDETAQKEHNTPVEEPRFCGVCYEEETEDIKLLKLDACQGDHYFCKDCFAEDFRSLIEDQNKHSDLKCLEFNCMEKPSDEEILDFVGPDVFAKYE